MRFGPTVQSGAVDEPRIDAIRAANLPLEFDRPVLEELPSS